MTNNDKNKNYFKKNRNNFQKGFKTYLKYSGIGIQMALLLTAGVLGGRGLDIYLEMSFPLFTLIFTFLGLFLALYYMIKELMKK